MICFLCALGVPSIYLYSSESYIYIHCFHGTTLFFLLSTFSFFNYEGSRYLRTQSSVFRSSLNSLMKRLNGTTPNYVRCSKTNAVKKPYKSLQKPGKTLQKPNIS